jgi:predicted glycosyltransferase
MGYDAEVVGQSGEGTGTADKARRLLGRAFLLYKKFWRQRHNIKLAMSHGARSQILAAHFLSIPVLSLDDYEFSDQSLVRFMDHLLVPFPIPTSTWGRYAGRVTHYPGLKEELYLCGFKPVREDGLAKLENMERVKVLFRPEGRLSHYRSPLGETLHKAILDYLSTQPDAFLVLMPRDRIQADEIISLCRQRNIGYWLPEQVVDGPSLIAQMDLVISGGGTMTREACALGVPSYSFFAGRWGAVDHYLQQQGRLTRIASIDDVYKIAIQKRCSARVQVSSAALNFVTSFTENLVSH